VAEGDGARVAKSTRSDRAAESPLDHVKASDQPQVGRDHPARISEQGFPVAAWECRVQSYGEAGLWNETRCQNCSKWLSYKLCQPCQSMLRLTGRRDNQCQCLQDSLYVYGRCEDHKRFENGPWV
jgi:hypothetical protein